MSRTADYLTSAREVNSIRNTGYSVTDETLSLYTLRCEMADSAQRSTQAPLFRPCSVKLPPVAGRHSHPLSKHAPKCRHRLISDQISHRLGG